MHPIFCCDPLHATRKSLPGWSALLGESSVPHAGLKCEACARATPDHRPSVVGKLHGALTSLEAADAGWDSLDVARKDAALRLAVRAVAKLIRHSLELFDSD